MRERRSSAREGKIGIRLAVFVMAMFVLIGLILFGRAQKVRTLQNTAATPQAVAKKTQNTLAGADTDMDGLKDWEEALYGTNPKKKDTDGDGTADSAEIRDGRNPNKEGPDDRLLQVAAAEAPTAREAQPNLTEQIVEGAARIITPRVMAHVYSDTQPTNLVSASDVNNLLGTLSGFNPEALFTDLPPITAAALTIKNTVDPAAARDYFGAVNNVYKSTFWKLKNDDLAILTAALRADDMGKLAEIEPIIAAFKTSVAAVKKIPVPKGYEDFAIQELTYLQETQRIVEAIRHSAEDPIHALVLMQARVALADEVEQFHQRTKAKLAEKGIVFAPDDDAYLLFVTAKD